MIPLSLLATTRTFTARLLTFGNASTLHYPRSPQKLIRLFLAQLRDSSPPMILEKLVAAEIYRDGGSYEATFTTDDGLGYGLWLQRSAMCHSHGLHHRWLFAYRGSERPANAVPVVTGSNEEQWIIASLKDFLARSSPELAPAPWLQIDDRIERLG